MRVLVITHPVPKDIKTFMKLEEDDFIIAVDQAVLALYKQRIPINLAVGDFDSLTNPGLLTQLNVVKLEVEKNVTDTYQAIVEAYKLNPDEVYLIGGIGGDRIEHFIAHLTLFSDFPKLRIKDEKSTLYLLEKGVHELKFLSHISFFGYPECEISLEGFKYILDEYKMKLYDQLGISNYLVDNTGVVTIHEGRVLVILTEKEKNKKAH